LATPAKKKRHITTMKSFFNVIKAFSLPKVRHSAGMLLALADQLVYSGSSFLTGIIVGRVLSIGDLGSFSLGFSLLVFSLVLQDNLLATPYTYHLSRADTARRKSLRAGAVIQSLLLAGVCSLLLAAMAALPFAGAEETGLRPIFLALALCLPVLALRECVRRQLFAELQMSRALTLDTIVSVLQFGIFYLLWLSGALASHTVFTAMAMASGLTVLGAAFVARSLLDFKNVTVADDTRENIRFGRWLLAGSLCHLTSLYSYPWLVYLLHGKAEAGAFSACFSLINLLNPFILGFNNYFRPRIFNKHKEEGIAAMDGAVRLAARYFILPAVGIVLVLAVTGGFFVRLLYGAEFEGLNWEIAILSISILPTILTAPYQLGVLALNRPQLNPVFHMVALAVTVIAGIPLSVQYGAVGAACGFAMATCSAGLALAWLYRREVRRQLKGA
jgi:O-antigen/teichoic acid export membrane protein